MEIYSKGDLIGLFSKYCEDIASSLDELVNQYAKNQEDGIIVDILGGEIPDISIWWDDRNQTNFIEQMNYLYVNNREYFEHMVDDALFQLNQNDAHAKEYEEAFLHAEAQNLEPYFYRRLWPHPVGIHGLEHGYGCELHETDGYKSLEFMCEAIGLVSQVSMTTNPEVDDLKSAFRLCIDVSTQDGKPISPKIRQAQVIGMFPKVTRSGMN